MPKRQIFNNKKVTILMKRYSRHKSDEVLRNRIIRLALPLVDASLSKHRMLKDRSDIRQECILKVIQALPHFDGKRGNAFGFLWATICNMAKTTNERLHRPSLSLSDDAAQREAEINGRGVFHTPENQRILNSVAQDLRKALTKNGFRVPRLKLHRKATRYLQKVITSGEFFEDKSTVVKRMKEIGLSKREIQFYTQYSLVVVRERLLEARENALEISHPIYSVPQKDLITE